MTGGPGRLGGGGWGGKGWQGNTQKGEAEQILSFGGGGGGYWVEFIVLQYMPDTRGNHKRSMKVPPPHRFVCSPPFRLELSARGTVVGANKS